MPDGLRRSVSVSFRPRCRRLKQNANAGSSGQRSLGQYGLRSFAISPANRHPFDKHYGHAYNHGNYQNVTSGDVGRNHVNLQLIDSARGVGRDNDLRNVHPRYHAIAQPRLASSMHRPRRSAAPLGPFALRGSLHSHPGDETATLGDLFAAKACAPRVNGTRCASNP